MRKFSKKLLAKALASSRLSLLPVRVRGGIAAGARWTLYPWTSYWRGTHEPVLQAALLAMGGGSIAGWSCWDLGAHFGLYSVGLAMRAGPTGQVAAFEPNPRSFARLKRHARMNRLPWLKLYEAAASNESGSAEIYTYGNLDSTTTHLPYAGEVRKHACEAIPVRTVRLDELVESGELRPPRFVKVDVEGHGHIAFDGMRNTLRAHRPAIIAAFHSNEEIAGIVNLLTSLDYGWSPIGGSSPDEKPSIGTDFLFTPGQGQRPVR
jgi:FkbM family methyltransferase